jgi:hypothetical protein
MPENNRKARVRAWLELRKLASPYIDMYLFEAHESRLVFLLELGTIWRTLEAML